MSLTNSEEIVHFLERMERDTKALKEDLLRICWFMRGGIGYNESHMLSPDERTIIYSIIEKNLQTTKETQMPFF